MVTALNRKECAQQRIGYPVTEDAFKTVEPVMAHIPGTKGDCHKIDEAFCFRDARHFFADRIEKPEIIVDPPGLAREPYFKTLDHGILAAGKVENLVTDANVFKSKGIHLEEGYVIGDTEPFVDPPERSAAGSGRWHTR